MTEPVMRRVRYLVLESLYEAETSSHEPAAVFDRRLADIAAEDADAADFERRKGSGRQALLGVRERRDELDRYIQEAAVKYPVGSLAVVDRNILRLAIWELLADPAAPVAAVVNEAVELAHRYGGESSPGFVNGVLRTISRRIRAARAGGEGAAGAPPANREQEN